MFCCERLIVRKEQPRPGAQLRLTDADGMRLNCFATDTSAGRSPSSNHVTDCGPGPRTASAPPGPRLRDPPLHDTAQNQIWLEIVQLALDLLAWLPVLALSGKPRFWEPCRLRLRLFSAAAQLLTTAHR